MNKLEKNLIYKKIKELAQKMKTLIEKEYLDKGYIIRPIKHINKLNFIRELAKLYLIKLM